MFESTGLLKIVQFIIIMIISTISHVHNIIFKSCERVTTKPGFTFPDTEVWKTPARIKIILQSTH